jgi:hypothetical protein
MQPRRPSLPLANSSTPRPCPAIWRRSRAPQPKSKRFKTCYEKPGRSGRVFISVDCELVSANYAATVIGRSAARAVHLPEAKATAVERKRSRPPVAERQARVAAVRLVPAMLQGQPLAQEQTLQLPLAAQA